VDRVNLVDVRWQEIARPYGYPNMREANGRPRIFKGILQDVFARTLPNCACIYCIELHPIPNLLIRTPIPARVAQES
jgi:hypothetical protein